MTFLAFKRLQRSSCCLEASYWCPGRVSSQYLTSTRCISLMLILSLWTLRTSPIRFSSKISDQLNWSRTCLWLCRDCSFHLSQTFQVLTQPLVSVDSWKMPAHQYGPGTPSWKVAFWLDSPSPPWPALRGPLLGKLSMRGCQALKTQFEALWPSWARTPTGLDELTQGFVLLIQTWCIEFGSAVFS